MIFYSQAGGRVQISDAQRSGGAKQQEEKQRDKRKNDGASVDTCAVAVQELPADHICMLDRTDSLFGIPRMHI
jgi:hypothetical protein